MVVVVVVVIITHAPLAIREIRIAAGVMGKVQTMMKKDCTSDRRDGSKKSVYEAMRP